MYTVNCLELELSKIKANQLCNNLSGSIRTLIFTKRKFMNSINLHDPRVGHGYLDKKGPGPCKAPKSEIEQHPRPPRSQEKGLCTTTILQLYSCVRALLVVCASNRNTVDCHDCCTVHIASVPGSLLPFLEERAWDRGYCAHGLVLPTPLALREACLVTVTAPGLLHLQYLIVYSIYAKLL